jgi:hypothetical protein
LHTASGTACEEMTLTGRSEAVRYNHTQKQFKRATAQATRQETTNQQNIMEGQSKKDVETCYIIELQTLGGSWQNLSVRYTESGAKKEMAEWRRWLDKSRKTWKNMRIVKETTTREIIK